MDCSKPGFPVLHHFPEFAQTHVLWVGDAIQPSHRLLSPSPPALNLFQHQGLFQLVISSYQVAKVLEHQLHSVLVLPMNIQGWFPLRLTPLTSLRSKGLSRFFSNTTVQSINYLALSFLCGPTLTSIRDYWKNHSLDCMDLCCKVMSVFFNMLSRLVIAFFPRSKCLLISWLQSPSAVILEPKKYS